MSSLPEIHETFSVAGLRSNVLVNTELLGSLEQFPTKRLFPHFPPIILLTQSVKHLGRLFELLVHDEGVGVHAPNEEDVVLDLRKVLARQFVESIFEVIGVHVAQYPLDLV